VQITLDIRDDIYELLRKYAKNAGVSTEELVNVILSFATTTLEHYKFFKSMLKKRVEE